MIAETTTPEQTDLLIVGAGPAGASLACFLSEYNLKGILISAAAGTSDTPRAHITNMAALECLRDIGLEQECLSHATSSKNMEHTRWCYSMAGEEFARIHSWGHDPHRKGEYWDASPCEHVDLPQTLAEPILLKRAKERGWDVRFNNSLVTFDDLGSDGVVSTITDLKTSKTYQVRSRYLFGCDGGRSQVVRLLDLPLIKKPGQGLALNILVETDLSDLIDTRVGNLHWTIQPDRPYPKWGQMGLVRMVKPWKEWMFIILPHPSYDPKIDPEPSEKEYLARVRDFIGDSRPAQIIGTSKWAINEIVAERYSSVTNNVHCLGDAVHRHPPFNGLGSNTCIQDAYNLAWKIAYVMSNLASPSLLSSYSIERQPVGLSVITRANQGLRDHLAIWSAMGVTEPDLESSTRAFRELKAPTAAGSARRKAFRDAVKDTEHEFHAVGVEMNQRYFDSRAVYTDDEVGPPPQLPKDDVLHHEISTYPGSRLPHAWLNEAVPKKAALSTQDLAGKGRYTLFVGPQAEEGGWQSEVEEVNRVLQVDVRIVSIGLGCEWHDVYGTWASRCGVEDEGAVLIRPDRFVAWRSQVGIGAQQKGKLVAVMRRVMGLEEKENAKVNGHV